MNNLWYEYVIERFATHKKIRSCGSCHGGCLNPAICVFVCLGYTMKDVGEFVKKVGEKKLEQEFYAQIEAVERIE